MTISTMGIDIAKNTFQLHGAREVLSHYKELDNDYNRWVGREKATLSHNKAAAALARKNTRIS